MHKTFLMAVLSASLVLSACDNNVGIINETNAGVDSQGQSNPNSETPTNTTNSSSSTPTTGSSGACEFGQILGYVDLDSAEDLVVAKGHAYVFAKSRGMTIFDVQDPSSLKKVKTITESQDNEAWDGAVKDNLLAVAFRKAGVILYDISDPANPKQVGVAAPEGFGIDAVAMDGSRLVATGGDGSKGGIFSYDISNPASPALMGQATVEDSNGSGSSVALKGTTAYYGQAQGSLRVFDVSEGATELKHISNPGKPGHEGWSLGLSIQGNHLIHSNWGGGWNIFDITTPQNPQKTTSYAEKFAAYDATLVGDTLYGAAPEGLYILKFSNGSLTPVEGSPLNIKAPKELDDGAHGIHVENGVAFVADNKQQGLVSVCVAQ